MINILRYSITPNICAADELVESIRKAMGDKEMAANLERIHNLYLDREEKPVEKAHTDFLNTL